MAEEIIYSDFPHGQPSKWSIGWSKTNRINSIKGPILMLVYVSKPLWEDNLFPISSHSLCRKAQFFFCTIKLTTKSFWGIKTNFLGFVVMLKWLTSTGSNNSICLSVLSYNVWKKALSLFQFNKYLWSFDSVSVVLTPRNENADKSRFLLSMY